MTVTRIGAEAEFFEKYGRFILPPEKMPPIVRDFLKKMEIQYDSQDVTYRKFQEDLQEQCRKITGDTNDVGGTVYQLDEEYVVKIGRPYSAAAYVEFGELPGGGRIDRIEGEDYYDNLNRLIMDEHLRQVIKKNDFDVEIPSEWLIPLPVTCKEAGREVPKFLQYAVLTSKVVFWKDQEMVDRIKKEEDWQVAFIDYLCYFIYKGGILDVRFSNLCISKTKTAFYYGKLFPKIVDVDTKPFGLARGFSRIEAAHIGLKNLIIVVQKHRFDSGVMDKVNQWIEKVEKEIPDFSKVAQETFLSKMRKILGL